MTKVWWDIWKSKSFPVRISYKWNDYLFHFLLRIQLDAYRTRCTDIGNVEEGNVLFNDAFNTFYLWLYNIGHMVKDHSEEICCRHYIGYSFWLAARVLSYAPSHRQDSTYHCRGALARMRNSSTGPPWGIDLMTHHMISKCSYHRATSLPSQ